MIVTTKTYAYATYEDGRRVEAAFVTDQTGVRMYVRAGAGVEQTGEWRGATVADRRERTDRGAIRHVIAWTGVDDDPLPFTLEHWGGCHCRSVLKRFRPPAWAET